MPKGLDRADRKLLIGAGILLVALVTASTLVSPQQSSEQGPEFPSSYSTDWSGAKAAFLLLQNLGYHVQRWERSPADITGDVANTVLVLANPTELPSDEERTAVSQFVQRGGRVVATGQVVRFILPLEPAWKMPQHKDDSSDDEPQPDTDSHSNSSQNGPVFGESYGFENPAHFSPVAPSPLIHNAPDITMVAPVYWRPEVPSQVVVYANEQTAAVVSYRFGKGEVIWWAAPTPLTNGAIRDASNLNFFLNSVAPSPDVRILWDEYFHGAHGSVWAYFARTPLVWGLAQFGIVFLAILATYSRRIGPVRSPATVSRLSPLEFVDTLGDLYYTAHANSAAIQVANQRLRFLLARQLAIAVNAPASQLARSASQQLLWDEVPLLETLTAAEAASGPSEVTPEAALALVQKLVDYTARLESNRRRSQGKPIE